MLSQEIQQLPQRLSKTKTVNEQTGQLASVAFFFFSETIVFHYRNRHIHSVLLLYHPRFVFETKDLSFSPCLVLWLCKHSINVC